MYSPLNCEGIGLSDGEVMERMWSYLRRFSKLTKEMRPSHRIDVLTNALLHYGHLTKLKLRKIHVVIYNLSYVSYSITSFEPLEESLQYKFIGTRDFSVTL